MVTDREVRESKSKSREGISDDRVIDKEEEKTLQEFDFYHGFLPREDLSSLLKRQGDYLIRISEVDTSDPTKMKREVILSVAAEVFENPEEGKEAPNRESPPDDRSSKSSIKRKSVVVRRLNSKYLVEPDHKFASLGALILFYQRSAGIINKMRFRLTNPIGLMDWEYLHSEVKLGRLLGEGAFGEVRQGVLQRRGSKEQIAVAVKLTKGTTDLGKAQIKELMREARLMRNIKHKNVVRFYGIAVVEQPLYIILELINGGSLNNFLEKNKGNIGELEKFGMCYGTAQGVEHLHKQNYIHRDLAARNCLYTDDKVIKISDFGLSRKGTTYSVKSGIKLPIRWLAPETIATLVFSQKTDVYSYGVIVYEIYADADLPWSGLSNAEVKKAVTNGDVLQLPKQCPSGLREFITEKVYAKEPNRRASMAEIVTFLENKLKKEPGMSEKLREREEQQQSANSNKSEKSKKRTKDLAPESRNVFNYISDVRSDRSSKSTASKRKRRVTHKSQTSD